MVDKLFHFFLVRYGKLWAERYANLGLTMDEIKAEWQAEINRLTPDELETGIAACRTRTFPPTLPEFVKMCWVGHPSSDEAWALALKAMDENETIVWTNEIMYAWDRCRAVYEDGDKVGARMAFKAVYEGLDLSARPEWIVSEGFDKEKRVIAMESAQTSGLLGMNDQLKLTSAKQSTAKALALEKLMQIKHTPAAERQAPKDPTNELKQQSFEKVQAFMEAK
jgi:hypothetical protein